MATIESYTNAAGKPLYLVRYRKPDRKQTTKRGFRTRRDANAFAATVETAKLRGDYVSPSAGRVTVGELGPAWLDRQRGRVAPSTMAVNRKVWRLFVAPRWESIPIGAIRFSDVQSWTAALSARPLGASFIKKSAGQLARILDDAIRDGLLRSNPARGLKLPTETPPPIAFLTGSQLQALAEAAPGEYYSLVLLLGWVGLRWGEATALRPCDINWLRRRIEISRAVSYVDGVWHLGTPKTGVARTVSVPATVIDALAVTAQGKGRDELMWTGKRGAEYIRVGPHSWFENAVQSCQAADPDFPRVTPHGLRHTAASLQISKGGNPKAVQRMLGHESAAMTYDRYAKLFDTDLDTLAERLDEALQGVLK